MMEFDEALERLLGRIETLGAITDTPGSLTRTFLSPANLRAARQVMAWMEDAGMAVAHDVGGTVRGVLDGRSKIEDRRWQMPRLPARGSRIYHLRSTICHPRLRRSSSARTSTR
jgi:hypothetical protein